MTSQLELISGKIARVLNTREVAINKGQRDGVKVGMIFKVLSLKGSEIRDPDTQETLGSVELVKTRVKVKVVYDRIAVATTYRKRRVNVGGSGLGGFGSRLFEPPKWETQYETLKTEEAAVEELDEEDSYVQIGDPVVQEVNPEEIDDNDQNP